MVRQLLLSFVIALTLGCQGTADAPEPSQSVVEATPAEEAPAETEPAEEAPPAPEAEAPDARPSSGELGVAALDEPAQAAAPAASARDLAAELLDAVGSPADCIRDFQPSSPRTVRIDIGAVVRPTGMVIEPSARGTGLSRNDQRCIEDRVAAVVLEPLSGQVSQTISTQLEVTLTPPSVESDEVAPPPPPAEGVVLPLPKKKPIERSGQPIEGPAADPIQGPKGVPIDGPGAVPIEGPAAVPIGSE